MAQSPARTKTTERPVKRLANRKAEKGSIDMPFLILTLLLVATGLIMLFSASYPRSFHDNDGNSAYYFIQQAVAAAGGIVIMLVISQLPVTLWQRISMLVLAGSVFLLLLVPIAGVSVNGAKRWLKIGIQFQPSEIAKLGVILSFASILSVYRDKMEEFKYGVLPFAAILVVVAGLLLIEPHLSATIIVVGVAVVMLYIGGIQKRWLLAGLLLGVLAVGIFILMNPYALARITSHSHPEEDPLGKGYQSIQSRYAIGSGGINGLGFGKSRQKYLYLPEEHNDYIFAIICEELGFIGALVVILLFILLIFRGYWIAMHTQDRFGSMLVAGIVTKLALQVALNIGVVTTFLPSTGISLPFFSYGRTALLLQLAEIGLVLGVSKMREAPKTEKEE